MTKKIKEYNGVIKLKFIFGILTAFVAVLCVIYIKNTYGNLFYMSYAVNSAKKISSRDYDGRLDVVSYSYDKTNDTYNVRVLDKNMVESSVIYSKTDGISNIYKKECEQVCKNLIRGKIQTKINDVFSGAHCNVELDGYTSDMLGEVTGSCKTVLIEFEDVENKEEFSKAILKTYNAIKECEFENFIASCEIDGEKQYFYSKRQVMPSREKDIFVRISDKKTA